MNRMNRRNFSVVAATTLALAGVRRVNAQAEQVIGNDLHVTSTGNVHVDQAASGTQSVGVVIDGRLVTQDGVYRDGASQVVVNHGQIVSTGDVSVQQAASGDQTVTTVVRHGNNDWYDGMPSRSDRCQPGLVIANPKTGQLFYERDDCCLYIVPCMTCQPQKAGCEGDYCGQ